MRKPTLRQKRSKETESQIVTAAALLFAKKGYQQVTMQDIADVAGIGKATLYYYTPGKEELGLLVLDSRMEEFIRDAERLSTADRPPIERIRDMIDSLVGWLAAGGPGVHDFFTAQMTKPPKRLLRHLDGFRRRYLSLLEDVMRQGILSGEFRSDLNPAVSARAATGMIIYFHILKKLFDDPMRVADVRTELAEFVLRGLTGGRDGK